MPLPAAFTKVEVGTDAFVDGVRYDFTDPKKVVWQSFDNENGFQCEASFEDDGSGSCDTETYHEMSYPTTFKLKRQFRQQEPATLTLAKDFVHTVGEWHRLFDYLYFVEQVDSL